MVTIASGFYSKIYMEDLVNYIETKKDLKDQKGQGFRIVVGYFAST